VAIAEYFFDAARKADRNVIGRLGIEEAKKERLGHPPLMVITLAQLGVLRRRQERLPESVVWFGKALFIAAEYQMRVVGQILRDLARLMKVMGENEFVAVWQEAFGAEPSRDLLDALREAAKQ